MKTCWNKNERNFVTLTPSQYLSILNHRSKFWWTWRWKNKNRQKVLGKILSKQLTVVMMILSVLARLFSWSPKKTTNYKRSMRVNYKSTRLRLEITSRLSSSLNCISSVCKINWMKLKKQSVVLKLSAKKSLRLSKKSATIKIFLSWERLRSISWSAKMEITNRMRSKCN